MKRLPFTRPRAGLVRSNGGRDRLSQFFALRSAFYHVQMLMSELEQEEPTETVVEIFAKAARRLSARADEFAALGAADDREDRSDAG